MQAVRKARAARGFALVAPLACMMALPAMAQSLPAPFESASSTAARLQPVVELASGEPVLPAPAEIDAPQPQPKALDLSGDAGGDSNAVPQDQPGGYQVAPIHRKYIMPDMRAQKITARDKVIIGLQGTYSLQNFSGMVVAAGYAQLRNGQPNYGTDSGAFGERLGAAAIRGTSQGIFTDSVFAPLLHEDPRYYIAGNQHSFLHRVFYAVSRPVITRNDDGRRTINGAQLLGYAASTALNNAYYPSSNRNVTDNLEAYAGSLGGSALSSLFVEFTANFWHALHIGR
jgi:hypothetical protein